MLTGGRRKEKERGVMSGFEAPIKVSQMFALHMSSLHLICLNTQACPSICRADGISFQTPKNPKVIWSIVSLNAKASGSRIRC